MGPQIGFWEQGGGLIFWVFEAEGGKSTYFWGRWAELNKNLDFVVYKWS